MQTLWTSLDRLIVLTVIYLLAICLTRGTNATRCYSCEFNLASCLNPLTCYNQPDTCSNTNFSPLLSQVVDCEYGCEQYLISDATGKIVLWRRTCATEGAPRAGHNCISQMIYFFRHEQCWCHKDLCNKAPSTFSDINLFNLTPFALISMLVVVRSTFLY